MNENEEKTGLGTEQKQDPANEKLQKLTNRGLNAATGGAWNKARNAPILGAAAKKAENKIADKLGNSKLGKKLNNPTNHKKPENLGAKTEDEKKDVKNTKSGDVGQNNLRNSLANRAKNLLGLKNFRKKKAPLGNSGGTEENTASEDNNEQTNVVDDVIEGGKAKFKIKLIIYGIVFFVGLLLIMAIIMSLLGINVSQQLPSIASKTYGTDSFESIYDKNSPEYKNEIAYYEKLNKVAEDYMEKNGEELKTGYIHATLVYVYYLVDMTEENLENLEIQEGQEEQREAIIPIDYKKMTDKVDKIVELMKPGEGEDTIDYSKNGTFYNNLKESDVFKDYYKEVLKDRDIDQLLSDIFDLGEDLDQIEVPDETVLTDETDVVVTNPTPTPTVKPSNKPTTSPTTKPKATATPTATEKKMSINEYIADSIYATTDKVDNSNLVKAYTITYSTNIVSENKKLTITSNTASASNPLCSTKLGCSYDSNGNLVDGGSSQSNNKNNLYYNGKYYYKLPLSQEEQNNLNKDIKSVFGNVVVNKDGTYPTLDPNKLYGMGDGDYKTIISNAYGTDIKYKNIGENSYTSGIDYGTTQVKTNVIFYDQKDYSGRYCKLKGMTIGGSGCALTAMAMITSTYYNSKKYDPLYMNDEAIKIGGVCTYDGTSPSFFCREASRRDLKCSGGSKSDKAYLRNVINHLKKGDLVIAHMNPNHFTDGGHYIVLGGVDPSGKVYVYDPNNRSNKKRKNTGNGWYSFNDIIVKEARAFYIVWKKG